jgi:adenylate kinase
MLNIVIFGPPGAGKGTQSQNIIDRYNLTHLSTGEILRIAIDRKTPLGIEAQRYVDHGKLVPDELVIGIIGRSLDEFRSKTNGLVFDGFPRTTIQAVELDKMLAQKDLSINKVLGLEVDNQELLDRIENRGKLTGRPDDQNIEIIKRRITIYNQNTNPVLVYYMNQNKYVGINGMGTIDEIFKRICITIDNLVKG